MADSAKKNMKTLLEEERKIVRKGLSNKKVNIRLIFTGWKGLTVPVGCKMYAELVANSGHVIEKSLMWSREFKTQHMRNC